MQKNMETIVSGSRFRDYKTLLDYLGLHRGDTPNPKPSRGTADFGGLDLGHDELIVDALLEGSGAIYRV